MTEIEKKMNLTDVQFRTLFKNIPLPTYTWKKKKNDLILIDYNKAALKTTKGHVKEFVGLKASEIYKDDKEILEDLNRCANEKIDISKDMKHVMGVTGKEKYLSVKYTFIPPNLVMVLTEDITKRRKAENEISEIKEFYQHILDNILNGVWVANEDDIIFYTNKGMENIAGIAINQITDANVLKDFPESTLKYFRPYYNKVKDTLKPVYYDAIPVVTPAGRQTFQSGWLIPRIKDNKYNGMICTVDDVTHLKQAERQLKLLNEELELKMEKRTKKLKASEEKYRTLINHIPGMVYRANPDWTVSFISNSEVISGYKEEDFVSKKINWINLIHPNDKEFILTEGSSMIEKPITLSQIYRIITKEGFIHWVNDRKTSFFDDRGNFCGVDGILYNITDQKNAEEKLKESEEKYRELFNYISSGVAVYEVYNSGEDFIFKDFNLAGQNIDDIKKHELIGKKVTEMFPGVKDFGLFNVFQRVWKTGKPEKHPITLYKDNRITGWRENYVYKLPTGEIVAVYDDITERKKAEQKLKESEEKFRTITEQSLMGICIAQDNKIKYINKAYADIFGYTIDEMMNWELKDAFNAIHPDDREFALEQLAKKQRGEKDIVAQYQYRGVKKSGEIIWVNTYSKTILYKGKPADFITLIDITEKKEAEQRLKESEEKYRGIFEAIPDIFFLIRKDGTYLDYKGDSALLYAPPDVFLGKTLFDILPKKESFLFFDAIQNTLKSKNPKLLEYSLLIRDKITYFEARIFYFTDNQAALFIRDISDRKIAEKKLKESEEKSKKEAKKLEILNQIMKESHNVKDLSQLLENTLNSTLKLMNFDGGGIYLLKENMREAELVYDKGLPSDFIEKVKRIKIDENPRDIIFIKGQAIFTENYPKIDPKHSLKWGILSLASIPLFAKNKVIGAINIASTKRHLFTKMEKELLHSIGRDLGTVVLKMQVEEKLKESEEKFRTIAEQSLIGIIIIQGKIVKYTNFANTMISGFTMKEILDWTIEDLFKTIHSNDLPLVKEQLRQGQKDDKEFIQYTCRIKTKYGKIKWVKILSRNIIYQDKEAVLVSIIDITEQKKAEQELINLSKLKSELLTRASHELKTPLISIKGYTELLLELYKDQFDNMTISSLNQIKHGSERLEKTINNILNTSYLESEQLQLDLKEEDLSFLIKYCVNEFQGLAKSRHHKISLHIQYNLITKFEKERIYEVLSNLIINAIKYTPPNGLIEINTETKENLYIISVKDNGIGFTEEEKERIFKQFGKIERYGYGWDLGIDGTGLGLYISKRIIELHGGEIWMESEGRNKGSTFYFSLPII